MSKTPAPQSTAAPKKGHSDPKTLPVPRPLSPRSGAAQKLSAPKPDSSGSGAAQRVVSGLRLRTTFSVAGIGLCGRRVVCGGGRPCVGRRRGSVYNRHGRKGDADCERSCWEYSWWIYSER
ncbi:hypothetical protein ScPMuIL_002307 [Solemya velum]